MLCQLNIMMYILTPFVIVVFMLSVLVGYIYSERGALVAGRLGGEEG